MSLGIPLKETKSGMVYRGHSPSLPACRTSQLWGTQFSRTVCQIWTATGKGGPAPPKQHEPPVQLSGCIANLLLGGNMCCPVPQQILVSGL